MDGRKKSELAWRWLLALMLFVPLIIGLATTGDLGLLALLLFVVALLGLYAVVQVYR